MEYIKAKGVYYKNEIASIRKKEGERLRPVFEAVTNSWEAILERFGDEKLNLGEISIIFHVHKQLNYEEKNQVFNFLRIEVIDNGQGLNKESYDRLITLRDDRKGFKNKGTGRIQFIHFFDQTKINSIYETPNGSHSRILVTLSKGVKFIDESNAIVRKDFEEDVSIATKLSTQVTFERPLDKKDEKFYSELSENELKNYLIRHFLTKLCDNKDRLPKISIIRNVIDKDNEIKNEVTISSIDIPSPTKEDSVIVNYSRLGDNCTIITSSRSETFNIRSFVLPSTDLEKNEIYLVSKGETAESLPFDDLRIDEIINGNRYMILLSGDYIDSQDADTRGNLNIPTAKDFKKKYEDGQENLFENEVILLENIKDRVNSRIRELHDEIRIKVQKREENVDKLTRMFLLNPITVNNIRNKVKNTDTDESILKIIYEADCQIKARQDAEIKRQLDEINALSPIDENYQNELDKRAKELVLSVPLQNRTSLAQYIARRKIVLSLFQKILDQHLRSNPNMDRIDEKILHNLIFQQSSSNTEGSDLWLINEEYIYFKGISESELKNVEYNGIKIFDKEFSDADIRYLNSLGEKRLNKRPDILLFPEEGKCIIIEFKAPDVNVAEHLTQIDFYASLLLNYTIDNLQLHRFYGYLIGENIEDYDVRGRASIFQISPSFDFWFCPSKDVIRFKDNFRANIYTEIIKYSSLLARAKKRNEIFIKKLNLVDTVLTNTTNI